MLGWVLRQHCDKILSVFFLKIFLLYFLYSKDYFVPLHIQN